MGAALRSVTPPAPIAALRAKALPRNLSEERRWAREREQPIVAAQLEPVSDVDLAECFGSINDVIGARLKTGGVPMTAGELALLVPLGPALRALLALARERVSRECCDAALATTDPRLLNLRLLLSHLDACAALSSGL